MGSDSSGTVRALTSLPLPISIPVMLTEFRAWGRPSAEPARREKAKINGQIGPLIGERRRDDDIISYGEGRGK